MPQEETVNPMPELPDMPPREHREHAARQSATNEHHTCHWYDITGDGTTLYDCPDREPLISPACDVCPFHLKPAALSAVMDADDRVVADTEAHYLLHVAKRLIDQAIVDNQQAQSLLQRAALLKGVPPETYEPT